MPFFKMAEVHSDGMLQNNIEILKKEMIACEKRGETIDFKRGSKVKKEIE